MNCICKQIEEWIVSIFFALILTSGIVMLYNYTGTHIVNSSGATDYKWMSGQYKANLTEGFNYMYMDANGFNNLSADVEGIGILLMGGSHMEAVQFATEKNTGSLLNEYLPALKTYNIGMSGHEFDICLDNLEAAIDEFNPSDYVIIQSGDLSLSLEEITAVKEGTLTDIPSYDSGLVYYLQKIPAIKVIYKQLREKLSVDMKFSQRTSSATVAKENTEEKVSVLMDVLKQKESYCEERGFQMIVAYTPAISITESGTIERNDDIEWVEAVRECCETAGIVFLDCYDVFLTEFNSTYSVPFGFNNSTMGKGHMNETGHRILAEVLATYIEENAK